ncbi:MAG: cadherin domain-containing protein, partial [Sedimenticolaceae bacterium]
VVAFTADLNDAPIADDDTYNVFEDIPVGTHLGTVIAFDPDVPAQTLGYSIIGGNPDSLFSIDAYGNITLAGSLDYDAKDVHILTVEVSDGVLTDTATITINVADENAPIALDSVVSTVEDTQYAFSSTDFDFTDQDGDAMASVTITGLESAGSLRLWDGSSYVNVVVGDVVSKAQLDNGDLVFDAAPDDNGLPYDSFTFSVNDDAGSVGTTSATMTVNVTPVNDSPVSPVTDSDSSINLVGEDALVGSEVGLTGFASDADPEDSVSYQLVSNPNGYFAIDPATGQVTVASPLSLGAYDVVIRATSSDGTSSEGTFTVQVVDAADDFATVHESALQGGSGRVETAFDSHDEPDQNVSAGNGTRIATGNLLENDTGATGINEINGVTPVGGVITVNSAHGRLTVDSATGDYTYTLKAPLDNSLTGDGQSALESFSYTTNIGSADLNITIVDDVVQSNDVVTNVAEAQVEPYQLVFTLDVSGSMTSASAGGVVYLDDGSTTTRLAMAKDALAALATEYFSQSDSVELYLSTFASGAALLNGGAPYTDLQSALTAINGINGSGGTNYEAGLTTMIDALDANGDGYLDNTASKAITYFISDGVPTSGNTSDPAGASGWDTFLANNAVDSYGVGIGAGISDFSHLDAINNVDADGSGTPDGALNVSDVDSLESVLLGTVPASFGGSVVVNDGVSHVDFGADGGFIQSITIELDTDADSVPDSAVTFVYDPSTGLIANDGGFAAVDSDTLTLDGPKYGFTSGTLIFNFSEGSYSYFVGTGVSEGDSFGLDFVAADGDGDLADSSRLTMNIVDGKPVANNDVDTLFSNGTVLEGNVITAVGTDGGVALGSAVTSFALQGSGVDAAVDDARVSALDYRGTAIDLTVDGAGSGIGNDGSTFSYNLTGGVLALTNATDGSQLVFNTNGYYSYVPADLPVSPTAAAITEVFTDGGTGQGVILSTDDGTVTYQSTYGAGIDDGAEDWDEARDVDYGETLTIEFDPATYIYGVANVSLELYGLTGTYESFDIAVYGVNGSLIGQYSVGDVNTIHTENLPAEYSNIGRIEIQGGSATEASIRQVVFAPVLLDTTSAGLEPEVIGYTLTDTDGQSDSATLTLSTVHNTLVGDVTDDVIAGTVANDLISGLEGDDILSGGDGADILEGGGGTDSLYGGSGSDRLIGGDGNDLLVGADGDDVLLGGVGSDTLQGDAGADQIEGGEGDDTLLGDTGNDALQGDEGNDSLDGGMGDDTLYGGSGNDILVGGDGNDLLFGNVGDDMMSGGSGADTFVWKLNEQGTPASPTVDVLSDFSISEGDALDISDLLVDEQANELTDYLHFEYDADNNQTVMQIDQDGGMFFRATQEVVLQGVDLTGAGSLTDQQIIDTLLAGNNLITD